MSVWNKIDETRLREMRSSGMTTREIADEFGITATQVGYCCSVLGIPSSIGTRIRSRETRRSKDWQEEARLASDLLANALRGRAKA